MSKMKTTPSSALLDADSSKAVRAQHRLKLAAIIYVNARHAIGTDQEVLRSGFALLAQASLEYYAARRIQDAVRIEVRAAEIAAQMIHEQRHDMIVEELAGWRRCGDNRERGSYPKSPAWQAGWLAAIIWSQSRKR